MHLVIFGCIISIVPLLLSTFDSQSKWRAKTLFQILSVAYPYCTRSQYPLFCFSSARALKPNVPSQTLHKVAPDFALKAVTAVRERVIVTLKPMRLVSWALCSIRYAFKVGLERIDFCT